MNPNGRKSAGSYAEIRRTLIFCHLILDLWGISFHAVVVFGLGKNLLFKSILGRCEVPPPPFLLVSC